MKINFEKYHGAGNDFLILDNRSKKYSSLTKIQITFLCNRHKGIGADGLILINSDEFSDFQMQYFNSDGKESSLCGNGARCAVAFTHAKKIISHSTTFFAVDGLHTATYNSPLEVQLEMKDVNELSKTDNGLLINTGSPHYIRLVDDIQTIDVEKEGASIRYSNSFLPNGINVNFVEKVDSKHFKIRTYERGVDGETLACGTGAVAVALGMHYLKESEGAKELVILAKGGDLKISFEVTEDKYHQIFLKGPATYVFSGKVEL